MNFIAWKKLTEESFDELPELLNKLIFLVEVGKEHFPFYLQDNKELAELIIINSKAFMQELDELLEGQITKEKADD